MILIVAMERFQNSRSLICILPSSLKERGIENNMHLIHSLISEGGILKSSLGVHNLCGVGFLMQKKKTEISLHSGVIVSFLFCVTHYVTVQRCF